MSSRYRHAITDELYTVLLRVFNVHTQRHDLVYINKLGQLFSRDEDDFSFKFIPDIEDMQEHIVPNLNKGDLP